MSYVRSASCLLLIFLLTSCNAGCAGVAARSVDRSGEHVLSLDYLRRVGADVRHTFTAPARWEGREWATAAGVAVGVGAAYAMDDEIRDIVQRNSSDDADDVLDAIEPVGQEYAYGLIGAFYLGGELFDDPRARAVGMDGLAASLIAMGLITQPLKIATGRSRPEEGRGSREFDPFGGDKSFPSGHATQAFALATVVSEHYDSPWVTATSYGLAGLVGLARLNNDEHWASDVLAGAAIGCFVGDVVVKFNGRHRRDGDVALIPLIGPDM